MGNKMLVRTGRGSGNESTESHKLYNNMRGQVQSGREVESTALSSTAKHEHLINGIEVAKHRMIRVNVGIV